MSERLQKPQHEPLSERCRDPLGRRSICSSAAPLLLIATLLGCGSAQASWLKNTEQEAIAAYQEGNFSAAAAVFSDPFRRGVALYRAGRYAEAEAAFAASQRRSVQTEAQYNLGNARFAQRDYAGAIAAYEQALSTEPTHDDALHNLALARSRLARAEQEAFAEQQESERDAMADEMPERSPETEESESDGAEDTDDDPAAEPKEETESSEQEEGEQSQSEEPSEEQEAESQDGSEQEQGDQQQDQQQSGDQQGQQSGGGEQQGEAEDQAADDASDGESSSDQQNGTTDGDEQHEPQEEAAGAEQAEASQDGRADAPTSGQASDNAADAEIDDEGGDRTGENGDEAGDDQPLGGESRNEQDAVAEATDQAREQPAAGGDNEPNDTQERGDRGSKDAGRRDNETDARGPRAEERGPDDSQQQGEPGKHEPDRAASASGDAAEASAGPDLSAADQAAASVDRFDQQGALPWQALDPEQGLSERPTLDGEAAFGPGAAVMEQRLQQVEGDPTQLMRNQFRLEEARRLRENAGQLREARPW